MKYTKKIIGKSCYLSTLNIEDIPQYVKWLNDIEITQFLRPQMYVDLLNEKKWFENVSSNTNYQFAIIDNQNDKLIGNCGIHNLNLFNQTCIVGIFIGDKKNHGKGFGTEAMRLLLDFGFNVLNLHNIALEVFAFNKRAIKSYEKVGFKTIGHHREAVQLGGKRFDIIKMDILPTEFESPFFKKILSSSFIWLSNISKIYPPFSDEISFQPLIF